jgi:hypothetical protein
MPKRQRTFELPKLPGTLALELQAEAHIIVQLVLKHCPVVQEALAKWDGQETCPDGIRDLRKELAEDVQRIATKLILDASGMPRSWSLCLFDVDVESAMNTMQQFLTPP